MICTVGQTNNLLQRFVWHFEADSENGEGIYVVKCEVFTTDILQVILEVTVQNDYIELSKLFNLAALLILQRKKLVLVLLFYL